MWVFLAAPYSLLSGQTTRGTSNEPGMLVDARQTQGEAHGRQHPLSREDSLHLRLLDIEIEKAEVQADQSDFWHRLIPEVRLVASVGVRDVFFIDPGAYVPYFWPTDTYRITGSISLSDLLNCSKHALANLELQKLQAQRFVILERSLQVSSTLTAKRRALQNELSLTDEEIGLLQRVTQYTDLLFQQGEIKYDAMVRSKLQLLNARKNLERLTLQIQELENRVPVEGEK